MEQQTKVKCYQKIYQELKADEQVKDLTYPQEKENLDFSCKLGDAEVEYSFRTNVDLLTIKASKVYPGLTDEQLAAKGLELTEGYSIFATGYDEKLVMQSSLPLTGVSDSDAERQANESATLFFDFLRSKVLGEDVDLSALELKGQTPVAETIVVDAPKEEPTDKNTFETYLKEKGLAYRVDGDKVLATISADGRNIDCECVNEDMHLVISENTLANRAILADALKANTEHYEMTAEGYKLAENFSVLSFDDIDNGLAKLANLNKMITNDLGNTDNQPVKEEPVREEPVREESIKEEPVREEPKEQVGQPKTNPALAFAFEPELVTPMAPPEKEDPVNQPITYQRAPEVAEQMRDMYAELNRTFEAKKSQMDYRENTLNTKDSMLTSLKKELEEREHALVTKAKEFTEKETLLQSKWDTYHKKKQSLDDRERNANNKESKLNEKELEILKKEQSVNDKSAFVKSKTAENETYAAELAGQKRSIEESLDGISRRTVDLDKREADCEKKAVETELKEQNLIMRENQMKLEEQTLESMNKDITDRMELVKGMEAGKMGNPELEKDLQSAKDKLTATEEKLRVKEENVKSLKEQLQKIREEKDNLIVNAPKDDGESEKLKAEIDRLNQQIETMKTENFSKNDPKDDTELNELKTKLSAAEEENRTLREKLDPEKQALSVKDQLASAGIVTEITPSEGDMLISGMKDDCNICVNETAGMIYVEHEVKKGLKYQKEIEQWNQESIRDSYMFEQKKLICKKVFVNVADDVMAIVNKFKDLR